MAGNRISSWVLSSAGNLLVGLLGVVSSAVLARSLGPAGRGELTEAMLWPNLVLTVGGVINTQSVVYFWAKSKGTSGRAVVLGSSLLACVVLSLILLPTAWVVNAAALAWTGKVSFGPANVYALTIPLSLLAMCLAAVLLAEERLLPFWAVRVANTALYLGGLLVLLTRGEVTVMACVLVAVAALAASAVVAVFLSRPLVPASLSWGGDLAKSMAVFGLKSNLAGLPYQLNLRLDQLLMSVLMPPRVLGLYVVAYAWSSMLSFLGSGVSSVMLSRSAAVDPADRAGVRNLMGQFRAMAAVLIVLGAAVALAAPVGVPLLFGQQFAASVGPATILVVASIVLNINVVLHELVRGLGHPGVGARAESIGLVVTVVLLSLLLPMWGPVGAAVASLLSYTTVCISLLVLASRRLGEPVSAWLRFTIGDVVRLRAAFVRLVTSPAEATRLDPPARGGDGP